MDLPGTSSAHDVGVNRRRVAPVAAIALISEPSTGRQATRVAGARSRPTHGWLQVIFFFRTEFFESAQETEEADFISGKIEILEAITPKRCDFEVDRRDRATVDGVGAKRVELNGS